MRRKIFLVGLTALNMVLVVPAARGQATCRQLQGSTSLKFVGFWTGDVELSIGGEQLHGVVSYKLESAAQNDGGVLKGNETATFDFGGGNTFTVRDHFSFKATSDPSVWQYNANNRITSGTGRFENAFGKFNVRGDVQFSNVPPTFTGTYHGALCMSAD